MMIPFLKLPVRFSLKSHGFFNSFQFVQTAAVPKINGEFIQYQTFPEHCVQINTCGKLYERWKKEKKYKKVPNGNLKFNVRYIDSGKGSVVDDDTPIVLALHGNPGSFKDYNRTISFLYEHGIRVIAPRFPDFNDYEPGIFRHSAEEKAQYIKDFLQAININHFDLLLCHSGATFPGLKLCVENKNPTIHKLALFNPIPFYNCMRSVQPWSVLRSMVFVSEFPTGLKFMKTIGTSMLKFFRVKIDAENYLNPLLAANVMVYGGVLESRESYGDLSKKHFPLLLAFSENDKLVEKELSYQIPYTLGLQDPHIFHYDEHGRMDKEGKIHHNIKVMAFEQGTHYALSKHSEILNKEILAFIRERVL